MKPTRDLLSVKEAMRYFGGVSRSTLYRWIAARILPSVEVGGRRFFDPEDLAIVVAAARV